jgi:hypothetical protein
MFTYCGSNHVNRADPSGHCWVKITFDPGEMMAKVAALLTTAVTTAVSDAMKTLTPNGDGGSFDGHSSSENLTSEQKQENVQMIYDYFTDLGWSKEAICGLLGNMDWESGINPGRWQIAGSGYGLVQWDPSSKYLDWAAANGRGADSLSGQLDYLVYSMGLGRGEWLEGLAGVPAGYRMISREFSLSGVAPGHLALVFMYCCKRPGKPHADERISLANYWYNFF